MSTSSEKIPQRPDSRHLAGPGRCGRPTNDGTPCQRQTGGDPCYHHRQGETSGGQKPAPPEHLGTHGRRLWRTEVARCHELGILGQMQLAVLENLCEAYDVRRNLWPDVKDGARIPAGDGSEKTNPAVAKHRKYVTESRQGLKQWEKMKAAANPDAGSREGGVGEWL